MSTTLIIVLAILFLVVFLLVRMFLHGGKLTDYFKIASNVYIWLNKKDAGLAAITAAKVAASKQRMFMVSEVEKQEQAIISILNTVPELKENLKRIKYLKTTILKKEWTVSDIITSKNELKNLNPDYLKALEKADISLFKQQYPKLASAKTLQDLINAAIKELQNEVTDYVDFIDRIVRIFPELENDTEMQGVREQLEDAIEKSKNT